MKLKAIKKPWCSALTIVIHIFGRTSGGADVRPFACLRPCLLIQRGASITTKLLVTYAPPALSTLNGARTQQFASMIANISDSKINEQLPPRLL